MFVLCDCIYNMQSQTHIHVQHKHKLNTHYAETALLETCRNSENMVHEVCWQCVSVVSAYIACFMCVSEGGPVHAYMLVGSFLCAPE